MQCAPTTATTTTTLLVALLFLWPVNNRQPHAHKTHAPLAALLPLLMSPLPLLTFWKTIKAIKKSLYKLAALAVYFFLPVTLCHWTLCVDQWRGFACSANACVAAQSETARLYVRCSGAYLLSSRWATRRRRRCRRRLCSLSIDSAVDFGFVFVSFCISPCLIQLSLR